ncbi:hypothetical protein [Salibacterium halotolerans]|uniref:Uncharacterized protein n=1 Tax=Salibacterium halotolerans TaxID=1884432 RepID=A0A1I5UTF1_9BACI|nr:hypothetical protein [Salibacterium halotolerans]SFP98509.1 hypothetical protein SAMN05518683_11449 [Salibacterium halotolerans]
MAFGITRKELNDWKKGVQNKEIAFLTHFWYDKRFPEYDSVTKAGCCDIRKLAEWGRQYGLKPEWIHNREAYPHFDLLGSTQTEIMKKEGMLYQLRRFAGTSTDYV